MPVRPCLDCGTPTNRGTRCTPHQQARQRARNQRRSHYHGTYQQQAAKLRNQANADPTTRCWICHLPRIDGDPWTADHLQPGDPNSPLAAAHRSCNSRRGDDTRTKTGGGT